MFDIEKSSTRLRYADSIYENVSGLDEGIPNFFKTNFPFYCLL